MRIASVFRPRVTRKQSKALGTEPIAFCRNVSLSPRSLLEETATPPIKSEWPLRHLEAEYTTMSKPCSSDRRTHDDEKTLSATLRMPLTRATTATIERKTRLGCR